MKTIRRPISFEESTILKQKNRLYKKKDIIDYTGIEEIKGGEISMAIKMKAIDFIPSTNRGSIEYEDVIKDFIQKKSDKQEIELDKEDKRNIDTIAGGLRRAIDRLEIKNVVVIQRKLGEDIRVFIKLTNGKTKVKD